MYKLQHRVKLPDGRLKYIICRHINITIQTIYLYALILSMSVIYNCKNCSFQRYLLHIVEYVLNVVEHGVYKYLFLNVKENEISVYLNCKKVYIFLSVKHYILKWMKICISKLQTYISILTLIEIVYRVYILFSEYAQVGINLHLVPSLGAFCRCDTCIFLSFITILMSIYTIYSN